MATTFLEPGGDATFNVALTTAGGFFGGISNIPAVATDFVHGNHIKSIKYRVGVNDNIRCLTGNISDTGARISFYVYLNALPNATSVLSGILTSSTVFVASIQITSGGILKLNDSSAGAQLGSNGATLTTGIWYRISLAYTITSTTVNRFELFVNGVSSISVTNATLTRSATSIWGMGNISANATLDMRSSDHYIDDSSSLTDPGDMWVTAKRPFSNGTTNGFTTQIGAGGSGYGTGHSPQVNERPLSTTNGWSMVGAGSAITEEYNIEGQSVGDITTVGDTIVDYVGWASMSSLAGETVQLILNGVNFPQAITSTTTLYTKVAGSTSYPTGTGTDIGIITDTSLTTVSLYECGILIAFTPPLPPPTYNIPALGLAYVS